MMKEETVNTSNIPQKSGDNLSPEQTETVDTEQSPTDESHTEADKDSEDEFVYIGGLSYDVDKWELGTVLTSYGVHYKSVEVALKDRKSRGFAYVQCLNQANTEKCLNLQNVTLRGRALRIARKHTEKRKAELDEESEVPSKKFRDCFIIMSTVVPEGTFFKQLQRYLIKEKVRFKSVRIEETKAYVKLKRKESEKLWSLKEKFSGQFLQFEFDPERSMEEGWVEEKPEPSNVLFVKNVPNETSKEKLKELFTQSLAIRRKTIKGSVTGLAFVDFQSIEDATNALKEMDGKKVGESSLFVQYSQPRIPTSEATDSSQPAVNSEKYEIPNAYGQTPTDVIKMNWLPDSIDKERLVSLFPASKNVTMTGEMSNNGRLNRLAYIEFHTAESALQARKKLAGRKVDGRMLNMMYSTGPPKSIAKGKIKNVVHSKKIV